MPLIIKDRVRDTSTTTGTGDLTVSGTAPIGFRAFSAVMANADTSVICIQHQTADEWEICETVSDGSTGLTRGTLLASSTGSQVSFSAGTKDVWIDFAAAKMYFQGGTDVAVADGGTGASDAATARTNLGLGTAATSNTTDFATAAQGAKADSALQASDIGTTVQAHDADLDTWATKTAPSGTVVGTSDGQVLTNKTFDTAGAGNVLKINGTQISDKTGTGKAVLDTSPALSNPTVGTQSARDNSTKAASTAYADEQVDKSTIINTQTASYTAVIGDAGKTIELNNASANTFTIPPNSSVAFAIGTYLNIVQYGAGTTTITPGAGVTIRNHNGLKTGGQYAMATLYKRNTDEWVAGGDLTT